MTHIGRGRNEFFLYALEIFREAGHAVTLEAIYNNHTPERFIYFDNKTDVVFSERQKETLKSIDCISHLFDIGGGSFDRTTNESLSYYSIEIIDDKISRSQLVYEVHSILSSILSKTASVIIFNHHGEIIISLQGYGSDIFLSDWFDMRKDFDSYSERINICNISLESPRNFFADFVYSIARWYYIYPLSGQEVAYNIPKIYYLHTIVGVGDFLYADKEGINEEVRTRLLMAEIEYGDDYVDQGIINISTTDFSAELDLIALEMEMEDTLVELVEEESQDENSWKELEAGIKDEYEFDYIEEELFLDPLLLIKWIEKSDRDA